MSLLSASQRLLLLAGLIVLWGLVMVGSASLPVAEFMGRPGYSFVLKQVVAVLLGGSVLLGVRLVPLRLWLRLNFWIFVLALLLLLLVLVPGLGRVVNGSRRWLSLGAGWHLQPSELAKVLLVMHVAAWLHKYRSWVAEFGQHWRPLKASQSRAGPKPWWLALSCSLVLSLVLAEPDLGSVVVIAGAVTLMLWMFGLAVRYFLYAGLVGAGAIAALVYSASYRLKRLQAFLDPWQHQFDTGYQLVQSLIAIGKGGLFGVGLGNSVQKLRYLPEAHTDFIFAILVEELGMFGAVLLMLLYLGLIWQICNIGRTALLKAVPAYYAAYLAYGIAGLFSMQILVNLGVNLGLLPTKGLALPLFSYGGSGMLVNLLALGLVWRVAAESKIDV